MKFEVPLPKGIDSELAVVVEEQGVYVTPEVTKVTVNEARDAVTVECSGGDAAAISEAVSVYLKDLISRFRRVAGEVVRRIEPPMRENAARELARGVYETLLERGWALQLGNGQVGLASEALEVFEAFDARFFKISQDVFSAKPQRYPLLIPTDILRRCNYFTSFPHLVSMISHFVEDYERLTEVTKANTDADAVDTVSPDHIVQAAACLGPAICYHCYQGLEGKTLAENSVFTAMGRCARYESTNMVGLDRLWEFSMREIILVGEEDWVTEKRQLGIDAFCQLIEELELSCVLETANDPFFAPIYANKSYWQSSAGLKFEGRFPVETRPDGSSRTLSCASFNLHQDFFGNTFDISLANGSPVFSGCMGFGLDRLVLAYFVQHGTERGTPLL